jgi:hypothetical protein
MLTKTFYASSLLSAFAAAAPAPQNSQGYGYTNADVSFYSNLPTPSSGAEVATKFGPDSQVAVSCDMCFVLVASITNLL